MSGRGEEVFELAEANPLPRGPAPAGSVRGFWWSCVQVNQVPRQAMLLFPAGMLPPGYSLWKRISLWLIQRGIGAA
jgi:hypothetical protein